MDSKEGASEHLQIQNRTVTEHPMMLGKRMRGAIDPTKTNVEPQRKRKVRISVSEECLSGIESLKQTNGLKTTEDLLVLLCESFYGEEALLLHLKKKENEKKVFDGLSNFREKRKRKPRISVRTDCLQKLNSVQQTLKETSGAVFRSVGSLIKFLCDRVHA
eukprot:TRINITY_DN20345_c0_g2_i1.p1 TRINITY_DN20345_c0_g2~~TRINITY_DN20345_c0_g2_i1.p1  ORF type:complete len:161 (+),score=7.95 TRINITY_DN20345_c0_g2_i1:128-610(+)